MSSTKLFTPLKIGNFEVQHRVAMAPLTRFRNDDEHVPINEESEDGTSMKKYYEQRASVPGTLIITEATLVSTTSGVGGYSNVPGIWSQAQIDGWKKITDAVHAKGSFIFMQLWALGRVGQPAVLEKEGGHKVKAPSAIAYDEGAVVPEELSEEEILNIISLFGQAAKNAIAAGFDGVEIHGANGYLADQFLQDKTNQRTDRWGGSIENRARFGLEVAKAAVAAVGAERVGYRLSPRSDFQGMLMDDPVPQFSYMTRELKKLGIAYLHAVISRGWRDLEEEDFGGIDFLVQAWGETKKQPLLLAGGLLAESATRILDKIYPEREIVAVFGRHFISNPDLPFRMKENLPLNDYDRDTFYLPKSAKGYADYPFSKEFEATQVDVKA